MGNYPTTSSAVTSKNNPVCLQTVLLTMLNKVLDRSICFLELLRKLSIGCWCVVGKGNCNAGLADQIANKAVMCVWAALG